MMNGVLMSHGIDAVSVPAARVQGFNEKMVRFYLTKGATAMMAFSAPAMPAARAKQVACTLFEIRIKGDFMGGQHRDVSTAYRTPSSSFWFLRERLPYSRALNTVMISNTSLIRSFSKFASSP